MPKWRAMYARHQQHRASADWRDLTARVATLPSERLLQEINLLVNGRPYAADGQLWGEIDYWASPVELFRRGGDCEDFAIAKYLLLREAGIPASAMRVLLTRDHAVLAVIHRGEALVLDNRRNQPYPLGRQMAAKTVFAMNERLWWVNTGAKLVAAR